MSNSLLLTRKEILKGVSEKENIDFKFFRFLDNAPGVGV